MKPSLLAGVALVAIASCGGNNGDESRWIHPPKWDHETTKIDNAETAASVVRHQQEDHCGAERLIEARCEDAGETWRCEFRTTSGSGTTEVEKDFGSGGEAVSC